MFRMVDGRCVQMLPEVELAGSSAPLCAQYLLGRDEMQPILSTTVE